MSDKPIPHGTSGGYTNHRCRCQQCRAAFAASMLDWKRRQREKANPPEHVHGTENGYANYSCRCAPCTKAQRDGERGRYQRRAAQKRAGA